MIFLLKILNRKIIYIFILQIFLSLIFSNKSISNEKNFSIYNINISEKFDHKFSKDKVIEKAFIEAFNNLSRRILISNDLQKIKNVNLNEIKQLIENFKIENEKFKENKYFATFTINFNKKEIIDFFEKKKVFFALPTKLDVFLLPILVENEELKFFNQNKFYNNEWNSKNNQDFLINYILPLEDIDDLTSLISTVDDLENLDVLPISTKYNLNNYILCLIYDSKKKIRVYSKIKIQEKYVNSNLILESIDLENTELIKDYIEKIKIHYDDIWKKNNQLDIAIKLPFRIILNTDSNLKIQEFENALKKIEQIYYFSIKQFDINQNVYEIIYNGNPETIKKNFAVQNIKLEYIDQKWIVNE